MSYRTPKRPGPFYWTPRPAKRRLFTTPGANSTVQTSGIALRAARASNTLSIPGPRRTGTLRQQVRSLQAWTKKQAPELKFLDFSLAKTNVTTSGSTILFPQLAQGLSFQDRIGDAIIVKSIVLKGQIVPDTDSFSRFHHRIALVQDTQQVADTGISVGDVFTNSYTGADPIAMLPNHANSNRFKILWISELFDNGLGCQQNSADNVTFQQSNAYECSLTCNIKVQYNGTTAADIQKNGLSVLFLTSSTANTIDFTGVGRVTYIDA